MVRVLVSHLNRPPPLRHPPGGAVHHVRAWPGMHSSCRVSRRKRRASSHRLKLQKRAAGLDHSIDLQRACFTRAQPCPRTATGRACSTSEHPSRNEFWTWLEGTGCRRLRPRQSASQTPWCNPISVLAQRLAWRQGNTTCKLEYCSKLPACSFNCWQRLRNLRQTARDPNRTVDRW